MDPTPEIGETRGSMLGGFSISARAGHKSNVQRMKILLYLKSYPDTNGRGESGGSPISHNYAQNRDAFRCPVFGHCFCPALGGDSLPFRRLGGECAGIHDTKAHDGDTITLPAGTLTWTTGVNLTKGITVSGQTTITGAGTANCTANDQAIIVDERTRGTPRQKSNRRRPGYDESHRRGSSRAATLQHGFVRRVRGTGTTAGALLKATIPAGKSFRLTGVTFKSGTITGIGIGGAIRYRSTGLVQNARIDQSL